MNDNAKATVGEQYLSPATFIRMHRKPTHRIFGTPELWGLRERDDQLPGGL